MHVFFCKLRVCVFQRLSTGTNKLASFPGPFTPQKWPKNTISNDSVNSDAGVVFAITVSMGINFKPEVVSLIKLHNSL
jgi:hypothetical protein